MRRLPMLVGLGCFLLAMFVSAGASQDAKKEKVKGMLPAGFKDLNLTAEQKNRVYTIQSGFRAKIADLNKKIAELKTEENTEVFKVLTDAQREQYLKSKGVGTKKEKSDKK